MKKVNVVITAGGTSEKIDEVRKITNMSTGALGVKINEELFNQQKNNIGKVYYITSKHSKQPDLKKFSNKLEIIHTDSVEDLSETIEKLLTSKSIHYFIHSAAISDYTTNFITNAELISSEIAKSIRDNLSKDELNDIKSKKLESLIEDKLKNPDNARIDHGSKISSKNDNLMITLKPTEKIISKIKELSPKTFLVGFKLLNQVTENELFNVSFESLRSNRCNLVLANDLHLIKKGNHTGMIVYPEKKYDTVLGKDNIAYSLIETMFKRGETRYPKSIKVNDSFSIPKETLCSFYKTGKILFEQNFLPTVENGTYGNLSLKTNEGFYITGRNVQKGNLDNNTICFINKVEELNTSQNPSTYTRVYYDGKVKPSIDSSIHHFIYKHTSFKAIVHVHTDKLFEHFPITDYNYACGTEEEMKSILTLIKEQPNEKIIQMKKHGLIILGETFEECFFELNKLLNEHLFIEPLDTSVASHEKIWHEWNNHYKHVFSGNSDVSFNNPNLFWIVGKNNLDIGIIYKKINQTNLEFALYGIEKNRKKVNDVAKSVISILNELGKRNHLNQLQLLTTKKCNVKNFYIRKHSFQISSDNEELIRLKKDIY